MRLMFSGASETPKVRDRGGRSENSTRMFLKRLFSSSSLALYEQRAKVLDSDLILLEFLEVGRAGETRRREKLETEHGPFLHEDLIFCEERQINLNRKDADGIAFFYALEEKASFATVLREALIHEMHGQQYRAAALRSR